MLTFPSLAPPRRAPAARAAIVQVCVAATLLLIASWYATAGPDLALLQQQLVARFGPARINLLHDWGRLVASASTLSDAEKLRRINDFFNQNIGFDDDRAIWQESDYWATPLETIGRGRGDCEDFAIAKYFSLQLAGVPVRKMRLIYVRASTPTATGTAQQAHMVLAYYANARAEPVLLDNLQGSIQPASRRRDLQPVFSFNGEGIYPGIAGTTTASAGPLGRLSRWERLLQRARSEGFH
ncbi:transglutaminase-like cysteine peptidase [Accumulibacter sp.]|uniref:transglutaminase-like cysteine peptidase n=1 Tax=Accumulibacter sp. TaxID=2053492 RepID=UPI0025870E22|nr:transglutaminase-like cysteine peptidase [Accumulibacter sp.]